ncbi:MAG: discoidin domain-containing protein [Planctomycetes bacterium]|nr:discoidin domain-containing protein [Planctomycetota bacterium]
MVRSDRRAAPLLVVILAVGIRAAPDAASAITAREIESDWLRQEALRGASAPGRIRPEEDAAGAVDGVKNGAWGFHTLHEDRPWWQVDLGASTPIDRIALYNRVDFAARNARILVLLSGDGKDFRTVYRHDGSLFYGQSDGKPLVVRLEGRRARYVRLQLPIREYFHLDEVEIYAVGGEKNIAFGKPATQSSISEWSARHGTGSARGAEPDVAAVIRRGLRLADHLSARGADPKDEVEILRGVAARLKDGADGADIEALYFEARRAVRRMALANPLLDFDAILFAKRVPPTLPHMSDQYYGWWSRPGGGIYILDGFKEETPRIRCLTEDMPLGSFLDPDLSYDGKRILFSYCRYDPHVASMEKVDKERIPEDAFNHIFEMGIDGSDRRRLTHGRYDDFDARYLPDGGIVFLSTRKGRSVQVTRQSAGATCEGTRPDSYVRCGGDNIRPVAVFTLHAIDGDGGNLRPISAFENFEWTPSVAADGRILYARWDYIDRFNGPFMSLWSTNPDGTIPQLVYGNYTTKPQCVFEARSIPGSRRLIFTAAAHHSNVGGSLAILDPAAGTEGEEPLERITPELPFPETEAWGEHYYANPWPLSEDVYLVAWADRKLPPHAGSGQIADDRNPPNASGIYLYDRFGNLELLHRDPAISSANPIPLRARPRPPIRPAESDWDAAKEGRFVLLDVGESLEGVPRGSVKRIRIVGVAPKVQPHMNAPSLGISREDPGKFVVGTVPVESDGSAHFLVPAGLPVFFQALDERGMALQTMRSLTYAAPGQTFSCIGCHEGRTRAPANRLSMAAKRAPSRILPGPDGSWPLRFDRLVGPVLERSCVRCHSARGADPKAREIDLSAAKAYDTLMAYAGKDLERLAFERDRSYVGDCAARKSKLLALLTDGDGHADVRLDADAFERLVTWMDTYAQRLGSFSDAQEEELQRLRAAWAPLLAEGAR